MEKTEVLEYFEGKTAIEKVRERLKPYIGTPVYVNLNYSPWGYIGSYGLLLQEDDGSYALDFSELQDSLIGWVPLRERKRRHIDMEISLLANLDAEGNELPCTEEIVSATVSTCDRLKNSTYYRELSELLQAKKERETPNAA